MNPSQLATFGGGCFWCLEAVFEQLDGVERVESGYAGGNVANPSYEQVCTGRTGHAEVIQITFDPTKITYRDLLELFFAFHDPTTLNRQGADVGTQYRSVIFTHSQEQKAAAAQTIADLIQDGAFDDPIVTQVVPLEAFYRAEDGHQGYFRRNPDQGYCRAIISPKLARLRTKYRERLKATAAT